MMSSFKYWNGFFGGPGFFLIFDWGSQIQRSGLFTGIFILFFSQQQHVGGTYETLAIIMTADCRETSDVL